MKDLILSFKKELDELVDKENRRQIMLYGVQDRTSIEWMAILNEEVGELQQHINNYHFFDEDQKDNIIKESISVATLSLKIAEMFMQKDRS